MGCDWSNPLSYAGCVGDVAKSAAGDAFGSIAESFRGSADQAVKWLWGQMDASTAVRLSGPGFRPELEFTGAIAATVAVALFVIQIIQSVLRREASGLARAARGLVVAFLGGGAAIVVVELLLGATDGLCEEAVKVATHTGVTDLGRLILRSNALTAVSGSAALLLLSLACILATVIVYGALVIRKVLILVTAVFAPLAFAGSIADITVSWTRRWIETTIALIVSKLILVLILVAGYETLIRGAGQSGSGTSQKVTEVISGILVLFVAGLSPFMALRIVHLTGEHARRLEAVRTSAVGATADGRAAQRAAPYVPRTTAPTATLAGADGTLVSGSGRPTVPAAAVTGSGSSLRGGSPPPATPDGVDVRRGYGRGPVDEAAATAPPLQPASCSPPPEHE
jgi:type IV secretion system protein TrbL